MILKNRLSDDKLILIAWADKINFKYLLLRQVAYKRDAFNAY